ncbi:MAG: hypothetical protein ABWX73_03995 [Marmoricola sp.]
MTTPQNPEEEPVGDELPEQPADSVPDEDALWRAIVDNYGDRPEIPVAEPEPPAATRDPGLPPHPDDEGATNTTAAESGHDAEEHYVPPPPPPLPTPPPARLLAWIGLFGVPMFVLLALVAHIALPTLLGLVLMIWFVGGFVFLVASMRPGPGEDHDDGARL